MAVQSGMRRALLAAALLVAACGDPLTATVRSSGTEQEAHVLAETARFAGMLHVQVRGALTETIGRPTCEGWIPYGWYKDGVAYFYRPAVQRHSLDEVSTWAAHEVCHAKTGKEHDLAHWECVASISTPTYPRPDGISALKDPSVRFNAHEGLALIDDLIA